MIAKRILVGLVLILSPTMLIASLGVGIGVWFVKGPVTQRATTLFDRVEAALGVADQGLDQIKNSLSRAAKRLEEVTDEQKRQQEPRKLDMARRFVVRKAEREIASEFGDAQTKFQAVAEAAVVINSVLEDVGNVPGLHVPGLDPKQLEAINGQLATVSSSAWELSRMFAGASPTAEDNEQLSRVERALHTLRNLVAEYEPRLKQVRERTVELRSRTLGLITPCTIIIAIVSYWIAFSQIIVFSRACSWWRRARPASANP